MKVTITVLIENTTGANSQLKAEHGLSFYVEAGETAFLFDTGSSDLFLENAKQMGIPPEGMQRVVLSHGHYDHTGGYPALLNDTGGKGAELFVRPGFFDPKFGKKEKGWKFLGNAFSKEELLETGVKVHEIEGDMKELFPGVWSVTDFERTCPMETANSRFVVERNGNRETDNFSDEQVLVIKSAKGLVVVLGCSHPGVINILEKVKTAFNVPIYAVIGGTHLVEADEPRIQYTTDYLQKEGIPRVMFCHCSGGEEHLKGLIERLGDVYQPVRTGSVVVVE